jgi:hypothetical protein
MMGTHAVDLLADGQSDRLVAVSRDPMGLDSTDMASVPLVIATRGPRHVPLTHPLLHSARVMDISVGDPLDRNGNDN